MKKKMVPIVGADPAPTSTAVSVLSIFCVAHARTLTMDTLKGSVTTTAYRASASTCIQEAAEIMAATRASALIVVDRASGHVIGIVTERDLVRRVLAATPTDDKALQGGDAPQNMSKLEVHTVMTANPRCVPEGTSCLQAMQIMCAGGFRHLPVVHDDKSPAGMMDSLLLAGSLVSDNSVRNYGCRV